MDRVGPGDAGLLNERRRLRKRMLDRAEAMAYRDLRRVLPDFYTALYDLYAGEFEYLAGIPNNARLALPAEGDPFDREDMERQNERIRGVLATAAKDLELSDEALGAKAGSSEAIAEGKARNLRQVRIRVHSAPAYLPASADDTGVWNRRRLARKRRVAAQAEARTAAADLVVLRPRGAGVDEEESEVGARKTRRSGADAAPSPFEAGASEGLLGRRGAD